VRDLKIFIPIKEESQRVPNKNFRMFGDFPLYKHTLLKFKEFDVYVDADSQEVVDKIKNDSELGHVTPYLRHHALMDPDESVCNLILHFISRYNVLDPIAQMHVTSPFLQPETIREAHDILKDFQAEPEYNAIVGCNRVQSRFWREEDYGVAPINHNPLKLEQTQDLPPLYEENSSFYLFWPFLFKRNLSRVSSMPYFYETKFPENLDIDTEADWEMCTKLREIL
jgi:CMP-N-acetylneuraminic acid synthetase